MNASPPWLTFSPVADVASPSTVRTSIVSGGGVPISGAREVMTAAALLVAWLHRRSPAILPLRYETALTDFVAGMMSRKRSTEAMQYRAWREYRDRHP